MLSPHKFSEKSGLSYNQVLIMCKKGELDTVVSPGGHYKIPEKELQKFKENSNYISREEYEKVVRENEKLKTLLKQVQGYITSLNI